MRLKGGYAAGTSYSVGDVVKYTNGVAYVLQYPADAGTPPVDTRYWGQVDPIMQDIVLMVLDGVALAASDFESKIANNLTTTAAGKVLDARQGKALKTLIDGTDAEIEELHPDGKTLVLASSTAESDKKFAITVDDEGELTAAEIVADGGET